MASEEKTTLNSINYLAGVNADESNGEHAGKPVVLGDYDVVVCITRGIHKGRVGYLDDQASKARGVVYFGVPLLDGYFEIRYSSMCYATDEEIQHYNTQANGEFAQRRALQLIREKSQ